MKRTAMKRTGFLKRNTPLRSSKRDKFHAVPVYDIAGQRCFDSTGESNRFKFLEMLQAGGAISGLTLHPKVVLIPEGKDAPEISWKLDYFYIQDGAEIYEDYKPRPFTRDETEKMKLWQHFGPATLLITKTVQGATKKRIHGRRS